MPTNVEESQWRALSVLRFVVLAEAIAVNVAQIDRVAHPLTLGLVVVAMAVWSVLAPAAYGRRRTDRRWAVLAVDTAIALSTLVLTPTIQGPELVAAHAFTVGSYWVVAPVVAAALIGGWRLGLIWGALVGVVEVLMREAVRPSTVSNVFLLCLVGGVVGLVAQTSRQAAAHREDAIRVAAAAAERERLSRAVHDGVLQTLAFIQRRGLEIGGDAGDLGRLAGAQESALRAWIRGIGTPASSADGLLDVARLLESLSAPHIHLSLPATPVPLPTHVAQEVVEAVKEALSNVERHCPPGTPAWVLLEDLPDEVVVTVRDEGAGLAQGRLDEAAASGRMGVAGSIRQRIVSIGGRADVTSAPGAGVEWELHVPGGLR